MIVIHRTYKSIDNKVEVSTSITGFDPSNRHVSADTLLSMGLIGQEEYDNLFPTQSDGEVSEQRR